MENLKNDWICTDSDNNQYGRKLKDKVYEFKQDMKYPDGSTVLEEMEINLNEYSKEKIQDNLNVFGYDYNELIKDCGKDGAEWLFAECIFECNVY